MNFTVHSAVIAEGDAASHAVASALAVDDNELPKFVSSHASHFSSK